MLNFFDSVSCETIIAENEAYEQVLAMVRLRYCKESDEKIRVQNIGLHGYSERRANYERVNRYLYKIRIIC